MIGIAVESIGTYNESAQSYSSRAKPTQAVVIEEAHSDSVTNMILQRRKTG